MDTLEKISLALSMIFLSLIAGVVRHFYNKHSSVKAENELLKMKVKAYEVYKSIDDSTIDELIVKRNSNRDKS